MFFGSEIKAILASGRYKGGPNWERNADLLLRNGLETVPANGNTFYTDIHQLPAGCAFEIDLQGSFRQWSFWSVDTLPGAPPDALADPAERFYEIFQSACSLRMRSDVPVGMLLSGGIDSASILCCIADADPGHFERNCPAISYQALEYDESSQIRELVKQTGVRVVSCRPEPADLWSSLEDTIWHQDEPIHSMAAVVEFELYRTAAKEGVKVVLNGGGLDEYLAGYPNLFQNYWCSLLQAGNLQEARTEIASYCAVRGGNPSALLRGSLRHLTRSQLHRFPSYARLARWNRRRELRKDRWYTEELARYLAINSRLFAEPTLDTALKDAVESAPLPLYLRIDDRNSMAHSVEARMPFMDYRLISFAFRLPPNWKMRGPWNKYLLRQAMIGRIPELVRSRVEKWGFPTPTRGWFASHFSGHVQDLLASRQVRERGIYNLDKILADYKLYRAGEIDITGKIFNLVQFELWSEMNKNGHVPSKYGMAAIN